MIDYIASKTAYKEHEERVRSQVPALVYDGWVRNRQPGWLSRQVGRLFAALGGRLSSMGERLSYMRTEELAASPTRHEQSGAPH